MKPKSTTTSVSVKQLELVFKTKGYKSREFYVQIEKYVYYLLNRYYKNYIELPEKEDIVQICFMRVLEKIENFDPEKGNLATFLHTTIRNKITNTRDQLNKLSNLYSKGENLENIDELSALDTNEDNSFSFCSEENLEEIKEEDPLNSLEQILPTKINDNPEDMIEINNVQNIFDQLQDFKFTKEFQYKYHTNLLYYLPLKRLEIWNKRKN